MRMLIVIAVLALAGCVSPYAVLENDKGEQVICQAEGVGIISGTLANNQYENCVSQAQMRGYKIKTTKRPD